MSLMERLYKKCIYSASERDEGESATKSAEKRAPQIKN